MKESKVIRILPKEGNQTINVDLEQDFDYLEILSLKILQKEAYRIFCSDKGVLVGKVTSNGNFPIQNAKISVFIPLDAKDARNETIRQLYPFNTPNDTLSSGKRYNLLPRDKQLATPADHVPVGTFPSKYDIMTNPDLKYIHEKYYKYTTTTNENGDYMFFGLPSGTHIVHVDVDLSDIGTNSVTPSDLINLGYSPYLFDSESQFKYSDDLNQLAQIVGLNSTAYVNPFWGDIDQCEFGLTRLDFAIARFVNPKAYFIGSFYTDGTVGTDNAFVPSACWQEYASYNSSMEGFKNGVSRIVRADNLRTPRQVKADGEAFGHVGIIEAIRLDEDGVPEYVGKWKTDMDGNFVIPLPLNLGKKVWDEDLQGWRDDDENGVATYADYRFKFYFEGQGDFNDYGFPEIQFESATNRGIFFAPNRMDDSQNRIAYDSASDTYTTASEENKYSFHATPAYGSTSEYTYNMLDQFGVRVKEHTNYARIRMSGFYTMGQSFNYYADYDNAINDIGSGPQVTNGQFGTLDWFFQQNQDGIPDQSFRYDNYYNNTSPDWMNNSIGTNPWIISRSYVYTDLYSTGDVTSRNMFPINYLFADYYMKAPSRQKDLIDVNINDYGGFVSNYFINRRVEASYRGLGYNSLGGGTLELVNGAGDPGMGNSTNIATCDNLPSAGWRQGELITNYIDTVANPDFYSDGTMDNCVGCLTFGSYNDSGLYLVHNSSNGSWYNEDAIPYYGDATYTLINPANTIGTSAADTITGNIMMGGFVAPYAAAYDLGAQLVTTCTNGENDWIVAGLSYCDATVYDCNNNNNWSFSGHTAYFGDTNTDGTCIAGGTNPGIAVVDFDNTAGAVNPGGNVTIKGYENGIVLWQNIQLKEGMGVRVTVRPTNSDEGSTPFNNDRADSRVGVCYYCTQGYGSGGCSDTEFSAFWVQEVNTIRNYDNRTISEPLIGSLYFPQYYVGEEASECCSRSNYITEQSWNEYQNLSVWNRTSHWINHSLLYAGTYGDPLSLTYRYYVDDFPGDPLAGQVITNAKYYNVNTIGEIQIKEITKDIPNFQLGINQWSSIDRHLPSSSAHPSAEMDEGFTTRETNHEDFDTNGNGTGVSFIQHKYFAPYDNLLFRTGQQWPRDLDEDGTELLALETTIPGWYDWTSSAWYGNLLYPVQPLYNPNGYKTYSNYHVFRYAPTDMDTSASWKPWLRRVPKEWYDTNTFWWSSLQVVQTTAWTGFQTSPWSVGNNFNNDKGADNTAVRAYPYRGYYFFSLYHNLSPAEKIKRILGYKTGLISE
tara:strand:+ start:25095 stop:28925 length:3831 start_codon:yes stop_codon:yes gene_type:complete